MNAVDGQLDVYGRRLDIGRHYIVHQRNVAFQAIRAAPKRQTPHTCSKADASSDMRSASHAGRQKAAARAGRHNAAVKYARQEQALATSHCCAFASARRLLPLQRQNGNDGKAASKTGTAYLYAARIQRHSSSRETQRMHSIFFHSIKLTLHNPLFTCVYFPP
jgi:hypothetical protein